MDISDIDDIKTKKVLFDMRTEVISLRTDIWKLKKIVDHIVVFIFFSSIIFLSVDVFSFFK